MYDYCMVSYLLKNTVSENGSVARGVCVANEDGTLHSVTERTRIETYETASTTPRMAARAGTTCPPMPPVSMNLWGLRQELPRRGRAPLCGLADRSIWNRTPSNASTSCPSWSAELIDEGKAAVTACSSTAISGTA